MDAPQPQTPPPSLRRRNSIATTVIITPKLSLPNASPPTLDLELISLKPSSIVAYTSLRDLLPSPTASVYSLTTNSASSVASAAEGISIRNRLVKQAAWAYLRPTTLSSSPGPSGSQFLRRIWLRFSAGLRVVSRLIKWFFRSVRIPLNFR